MGVVNGSGDVVEGATHTGVDVRQRLPRAAPVALRAGEGITGVDRAVVTLRAAEAGSAACLVCVFTRPTRGGSS